MEKKHPIDQLFSERLGSYERRPSPAAWQKVNERLENKKTHLFGGWVTYTIAASLALLLLAGWWWLGNQPVDTNMASTDTPNSGIVANKETTERPFDDVMPQNSISKSVEAITTAKLQQVPTAKRMPSGLLKTQESLGLKDVAKQETLAQENHPSQQPAVINPVVEEKISTKLPEQQTMVAQVEPKYAPEQHTTLVVNITSAEDLSTTKTITDESLMDEKVKKQSRVARIFKQLKKAKEGEQVDWNEVGFDPNRLVAKADEIVRPKNKNNEK
jgi:hypothetical protein